jgi:hypothetical protein
LWDNFGHFFGVKIVLTWSVIRACRRSVVAVCLDILMLT